jgi:ABC-2 type transport system permease protein
MNIRSILAIARKDALDTLLNKSSLIGLLTPIILAVLFAILSSLLGGRTSQLLIYNPGNSGVEQAVSSFFASPQIIHAGSANDVVAAFGADGSHKDTAYLLGLIVPADFDAQLRRGEHPDVKLFLNGNELNNRDRDVLVRLITYYASATTNPQSVNLSSAMINPPRTTPVTDAANTYIALSLLMSFLMGTSLISSLLVEEKEKKTMRMLLVSPASYADVVMGKLLVSLGYQLVLSGIVLIVMHGFTGNIAALLFMLLLSSCFALTLGLLIGSLLRTTTAQGGIIGALSLVFVYPALFAGALASLFQGSLVVQIAGIFPTYYIADGLIKALSNQSLLGAMMLDIGVVLVCTVVLFVAATWSLRRQAAVVATI